MVMYNFIMNMPFQPQNWLNISLMTVCQPNQCVFISVCLASTVNNLYHIYFYLCLLLICTLMIGSIFVFLYLTLAKKNKRKKKKP